MAGVPQFVSGHLVWTSLGSVWAVWNVEAFDYLHASQRNKVDLHDRTRAALLAMNREAMIMSVCEPIDLRSLTDHMSRGVDMMRAHDWPDHVAQTYEYLSDIRMHRRRLYLAVSLDIESASRVAFSGLAGFAGAFGAAPIPVRAEELRKASEVAERLERTLRQNLGRGGGNNGFRRTSEDELLWLFERPAHRGINELPFPHVVNSQNHNTKTKRVRIEGGLLAEAGFPEDRKGRRMAARKFLRVDTDEGSGYQTMFGLSVMPSNLPFPGSEWLLGVEQVPFPVDWTMRIKVNANQDALLKINRKRIQLRYQQIIQSNKGRKDVPSRLSWAIDDLDAEQAELESNPSQGELEVSTFFAMWAPNLRELDRKVEQFKNVFQAMHFSLHAPIGGQRALYEAMTLGSTIPAWPNDFLQVLLPGGLAASQPFAGVEVGDPRGILLGENLSSGVIQPVLFDPAYGPSGDGPHGARSGSIGILGDLGSGKSYLAKKLCHATIIRGGQVVVFDRTPVGEWVRFGSVLPGRPQTIDVKRGSKVSLDPLRVFGGDVGQSTAIATLGLLARVGPTEAEGVAISEAVKAVCKLPNASLASVLKELNARGAQDEGSAQVLRRIRAFEREPLAQMLFGNGRPLSLDDADFIVFHAPDLDLPSPDEWKEEHLARLLAPSKIISQALLFLVSATARHISFINPRRFSAVVIEEAWAVLANSQGARVAQELIKDGRKHNAALWLISQSPDDFPTHALAAHLGAKFLFRQGDRTAARKSLELFSMDTSEVSVDLVNSSMEEGQCLYTDVEGRTGLIQVLQSIADLHEASQTDYREAS